MRTINFLGVALLALSLVACNNGASFGIAPKEDSFSSVALYNNKVDIIWLVDDSSSMGNHQKNLTKQIPDLVAQLNSLGMDYRMVVTTTTVGTNWPGGAYVGSPAVLSSSTPNLTGVLSNRLLVGSKGSNFERGILSLQNLLSQNYIEGAGAGFHREDALLVINILADGEDSTEGSTASLLHSLTTRLNDLKKPRRPNVGGWLANYIGVTKSSDCPNDFGTDETGYRYLELVKQSQGKAYPICVESLKGAVDGLKARLLEIITDYPLSDIPDLMTVKVYMDGVLVPRSVSNGWSYVPELNVIRFHGTAVPSVDSSVKVSFTPASAS